jgi:catechol 2,3-dioxygenase-like lactoylglutathione lyase family enzyme
MAVRRLLRVSITVADLGRTVAFYRDRLGLDAAPTSRWTDPGWLTVLGLDAATDAQSADVAVGRQIIEAVAFDPPGRPYPSERAANDPWFEHVAMVTHDIAATAERLRRGAPGAITHGPPVVLPPNTGGVSAFKFRDPEGHPLELISFPEGVGAPVWRGGSEAGLLGYDHTAVVVTDLKRSLAFYVGLLGFRIGGRSLNRGAEQDRLDGLAGCEVDVVALEPAEVATPHVELLHYRSPRGGAATERMRASDVASTRQVHAVDDLDALVARLRAEGVESLGDGVVALTDGHRAASVRDPDGHTIVLLEAPAGRRR